MEIPLNTGRRIYLQHLNQSPTYEGLLLGLPSRELNEALVNEFQQKALETLRVGYAHVITPTVLEVDCTPERRQSYLERGKHVERIPAIGCTALFHSSGVRRKDDPDIAIGSVLAVVWFQDDFALPIDPRVVTQIKKIRWSHLAETWDP